MTTGLGQDRCLNHPDRFGHARCVQCRRVVCQECATEWDGMNYCVACLATVRAASTEKRSVLGWALLTATTAVLFLLLPRLIVWGTVLLGRL